MPSFQIDPELQRPPCDDPIQNLCWLAREILATHMEEGAELTDEAGTLVNEAEDTEDSLTIHTTASVSLNKKQSVNLSNLPLIHDARGEVIPWTEPGYVALSIENIYTEDNTQYIFQLPTPDQTKAAIFSGFSFTERAQITAEDTRKLQRLEKLLSFVRTSLRHQMQTNTEDYRASYHSHVPRQSSLERFDKELTDFWGDENGQRLKDLPFERHETTPVEPATAFAEMAYEMLTTYGSYQGRMYQGNWIEKVVTDRVEFGEDSQHALRLRRVATKTLLKTTGAKDVDDEQPDSDTFMGIALEHGVASGTQSDDHEITNESYDWNAYVLAFTGSHTGISELLDGATGHEVTGSDAVKALDYLALLKNNLASISFDSALRDNDQDSSTPRSTPLPTMMSEYPYFIMPDKSDDWSRSAN
jgi:hypothetical protein